MKTLKAFAIVTILFSSLSACSQSRVTVVRHLPRDSRIVVHSGVRYSYHGGLYYRPYGTQYVVVRPPVGLVIGVLPVGYTRVVIGKVSYFYSGGVYYLQKAPGKYVVVEPTPSAAVSVLAVLPATAQTVHISGKTYFKVNNTYYEKCDSEGYVAVGNVQQPSSTY